jgi:phosphate transport system substrate-binding protein
MAAREFLHFKHFVNRSAGWSHSLPASLLSVCALLLLSGCTSRSPRRVEDSETSGRIQIVSVPEGRDLIRREVAAFRAQYPDGNFEVVTGTSREAVTALLEKRSDLALLMRELEPEERSVMVKGGMELEGYRFGRDAICVIVNPANRVSQMGVDELRRIYLGQLTDWNDLGGRPGRIEPVVCAPGSDLMTSFVQRVLGGENPTAPALTAVSDSDVVARVVSRPGAIGFVSMAWADRGAKAIPLSALTGLRYWQPDAERVYTGDYPLTRYCNLYVRSGGPRLANGLVTFISSMEGQRIVHEAGLVPTAVPVRFARRSPMLGDHPTSQGESTTSP